jgi:hypothetical protein
MKKRFINIFTVILVAAAISSCNKNLDQQPNTDIDAGSAIKTSDDVKAVLIGAYANMGASSSYGGRIFLDQDLLANYDDIDWTGTYQGMTQIYNKAIPVDNSFVSDDWLAGYKTINDVNNVLANISLVDDVDKIRVEGEAKFIRAATYFSLVQIFAKDWNNGDPQSNLGVPIVLTPTKDIDSGSIVARNTVAEVYAQIITDLKDAANDLQDNVPGGVASGYASEAAADAILARVYLQQSNFASAANAANSAINISTDAGLHLMPNFADEFPNLNPPDKVPNTAEDIFSIQVTTTAGINGYNEFYAETNRGDITVTDDHLAKYEDGDDRINMINEDYYVAKFDNIYGNVHTIRLAEMYLIRAEANYRNHSSVGDAPLNDINLIRNRAKLGSLSEGNLSLDAILHERFIELTFEGFALQDVKRNKQSVGNLEYNSPKLVFPIPIREIRVNPKLVQNDGYN